MTLKDMLARLPRESLLKMLTAARCMPDFRCTNQLRVAATNALRTGTISADAIMQEYHYHIGE